MHAVFYGTDPAQQLDKPQRRSYYYHALFTLPLGIETLAALQVKAHWANRTLRLRLERVTSGEIQKLVL